MRKLGRAAPAEQLSVEEVPVGHTAQGRFLEVVGHASGGQRSAARRLLKVQPAVIEVQAGEQSLSVQRGYDRLERDGDAIVGLASFRFEIAGALRLEDRWTTTREGDLRIRRSLRASEGAEDIAARVELWLGCLDFGKKSFASLRYLAPALLYDKNDLDDDGREDYLLASSVIARDDRIANRAFLAYDEDRKYALTFRRADAPLFDAGIASPGADGTVILTTDVGSLGIEEAGLAEDAGLRLVGCYPFAERPHSFALRVAGRPGWRALRPITGGQEWRWEYELHAEEAECFNDAMWGTVTNVAAALRPVPVALRADPDEVCRLRLNAASRYFVEGTRGSGAAYAGTALNCHPQDGVQLSNIIQLGFTGQNVLLAHDYLRGGRRWGDEAMVERGRKVVDFMASEAQMGNGMLWNLYNVDADRLQSWWGGLILPLAYADEEGVRALMGPLRDHLAPVIERLTQTDGAYLRGMSEENEALIRCYQYEAAEGRKRADWLRAAQAFGDFLVRVQDDDGGWYRAYDINEHPITDPVFWFGTKPVELKCSTSLPVPFLVRLGEVTGDDRYRDAALKAGRFVADNLVEPVKWSGGIHDSIYGKGMLVDNEAVLFCMEALEALWRATGDVRWRRATYSAAQQCASWVFQWDVPLPIGSTLERHGFRTTGMGACDTCAGGSFVHPFLLRGLPTLLEIGLRERDRMLVDVAELCFGACNQTVALWDGDWDYAVAGLQEEGYLVSAWLIDDPMFVKTGFGGRSKGEGNKTGLSWVNATGAYCFLELVERFGTADVAAIREGAAMTSLLGTAEGARD